LFYLFLDANWTKQGWGVLGTPNIDGSFKANAVSGSAPKWAKKNRFTHILH